MSLTKVVVVNMSGDYLVLCCLQFSAPTSHSIYRGMLLSPAVPTVRLEGVQESDTSGELPHVPGEASFIALPHSSD